MYLYWASSHWALFLGVETWRRETGSPFDRCQRFHNFGVSVGDNDNLLHALLWTESWDRVGRIHLETLGPQPNEARAILYCKIMA
jgi:hypothetical protein